MNGWRRLQVLTWLTLCVYSCAEAQLPQLPPMEQFGLDGFRLMLQHEGPEPTQTLIGSALDESPSSTALVIMGDLSTVPRFRAQIHRFVDRGGVLLVASDLRGSRVPPAEILGVWVTATGLAPRKAAYREFGDCPVVTRLDRQVGGALFENVNSIVTNRPGQLTIRDAAVHPIAWLPALPARREPVLMAIYQRGAGRMLFIADHSIFVNEMLIHGDNARFASNVCRWLFEDGKRSTLIVIHDNRVLPAWGLGDTPPAIPLSSLLQAVRRGGWEHLPIGDSALPVLNASLADFQQTNQWNTYLRDRSRRMFGGRPLRAMLLLLAGLSMATLLTWLVLSPSRPPRWWFGPAWLPTAAAKLAQVVRGQHDRPGLRVLARALFVEWGITDWSAPRPPAVRAGSQAVPRRTSRDVAELWRIATSEPPPRLSQRACEKQLKRIQALRELQLSGDLSLE